jgi:hypothetical protein
MPERRSCSLQTCWIYVVLRKKEGLDEGKLRLFFDVDCGGERGE